MKKTNFLFVSNTSPTNVTLIPKGRYPTAIQRAQDSIFVQAGTFKLLDPHCFLNGYGFIDLDEYYFEVGEPEKIVSVDDCNKYGIDLEYKYIEYKK